MRVLHHPNIITLLEVIETSSMLCLVLEMCPVDVLSHLCEKGVMPEHQARRHGRELLSAFEYMHHRGVVHRDLKVSPITLLPFARFAPYPAQYCGRTGTVVVLDLCAECGCSLFRKDSLFITMFFATPLHCTTAVPVHCVAAHGEMVCGAVV